MAVIPIPVPVSPGHLDISNTTDLILVSIIIGFFIGLIIFFVCELYRDNKKPKIDNINVNVKERIKVEHYIDENNRLRTKLVECK